MKMDRKYPRASVGVSARPVEIVANYLRELAAQGKGCASNNATIAGAVGLSVEAVVTAKRELVTTRRLVGEWQTWLSIDGVPFGRSVVNDVERLKATLRRAFRLVCDPRTIDSPDAVPKGPPRELVVGDRRMTLAEAWELAASLGLVRSAG